MILKKIAFNNFSLVLQYLAAGGVTLVTVPWIVKDIGLRWFGEISAAQVFSGYCVLFISYCFQSVGPQKISQANSSEECAEIFLTIQAAKAILSTPFFLLALLCILFLPINDLNKIRFLVVISFVLAALFNSVWYFQGKSKFGFLSVVSIIGSILSISSCAFFVTNGGVFASALTLTISPLFLGVMTFVFAIKELFPCFDKIGGVSFSKVRKELRDGLLIFLSQAVSLLYMTSGIFIIYGFSGPQEAAIFSAVDRFSAAAMGALVLVFTATFPYLSRIYIRDISGFVRYSLLVVLVYILLVCCVFVFVLFFNKEIQLFIFGDINSDCQKILISASVWLFFGIFGPVLTGYWILSGKAKKILGVNIATFFMVLATSFLLVDTYGALGWYISLLSSQSILLYCFCKEFYCLFLSSSIEVKHE